MNCQQIPLIEFIRSDLEAEETQQVLRHLEGCSQCRERLQVIVGLEAIYADGKPRKLPRLWLLAAALAVLILIPVFYVSFSGLPQGGSSLARLATKEKYPYFPLQTRSSGKGPAASTQDRREQAFAAYNAGDFATAARGFLKTTPDPEILFYLGITHYFLEQPANALDSLKKAKELEPRWRLPALWYQANIFLKTEREPPARDALTQLLKAKGEYEAEARELLRQLEH